MPETSIVHESLQELTATLDQHASTLTQILEVLGVFEQSLARLDPGLAGVSDIANIAGVETVNTLLLEKEAKEYTRMSSQLKEAIAFIIDFANTPVPSVADREKLGSNILQLLRARKYICEEYRTCSTDYLQQVDTCLQSLHQCLTKLLGSEVTAYYDQRKPLQTIMTELCTTSLYLPSQKFRTRTGLVTAQAATVPLHCQLHSIVRIHVHSFLRFATETLSPFPLMQLAQYFTLGTEVEVMEEAENVFLQRQTQGGLKPAFNVLFNTLKSCYSSPDTFKNMIIVFLKHRIAFLLTEVASVVSVSGHLQLRSASGIKTEQPYNLQANDSTALILALYDFLQTIPDKSRIANHRDLADYTLINDHPPRVQPEHGSVLKPDERFTPLQSLLHHMTKCLYAETLEERQKKIHAHDPATGGSYDKVRYTAETHPFFFLLMAAMSALLEERSQLTSLFLSLVYEMSGDKMEGAGLASSTNKLLLESTCRLADACYGFLAAPIVQYVCQVGISLITAEAAEAHVFETYDMLQVVHTLLPVLFLTNCTEIMSYSIGGLPMSDSPSSAVAQKLSIDQTVFRMGSPFVNGLGLNIRAGQTVDMVDQLDYSVLNSDSLEASFRYLSPSYTVIRNSLNQSINSVVAFNGRCEPLFADFARFLHNKTDAQSGLLEPLRHELLLLISLLAKQCDASSTRTGMSYLQINTRTNDTNVREELPRILTYFEQQMSYNHAISLLPGIISKAGDVTYLATTGTASSVGQQHEMFTLKKRFNGETRFTCEPMYEQGLDFRLEDYRLPESHKNELTELRLYYMVCQVLYQPTLHKLPAQNYLFRINNMNYLCEAISQSTRPIYGAVSSTYRHFLDDQLTLLIQKYCEKIWIPLVRILDLSGFTRDIEHVYQKWHARGEASVSKAFMADLEAQIGVARDVEKQVLAYFGGAGAESTFIPTESMIDEPIDETVRLGANRNPLLIKSKRLHGRLNSTLPRLDKMFGALVEQHVSCILISTTLQNKLREAIIQCFHSVLKEYHSLCQISAQAAQYYKSFEKLLPDNVLKTITTFFAG